MQEDNISIDGVCVDTYITNDMSDNIYISEMVKSVECI